MLSGNAIRLRIVYILDAMVSIPWIVVRFNLIEYSLDLGTFSFGGMCFFNFHISKRFGVYFQCRAPPSDFDSASQLKNRNRRITYEENQSAGLLPVLFKRYSC